MASMCRIHSILCQGIKNATSYKCGGLSQNFWMSQLQRTTKTSPHQQNIPQKFSTSTRSTGMKLFSHIRAPGPRVLKSMVAFTMPLSFKSAMDRLLGRDDMIIPVVGIDNIPREVYQEVIIIKTEPGFLMRIVYFFWNILRISFRTIRIIYTLVPLLCLYPLTWTSAWMNEKWWNLLVLAIQSIGPTFVKLGQWASTRRDLFSEDFCNKLSKLHRRTKPHSWYFTKKKLEKGFGKRWKEILKFDDKHHPIGSGCVAQVYKAYMPQEMVLDDDVLNEILLEIEDQDDPTIMDAFEVLGFHDIIGQIDKGLGEDSDANSTFKGKPYVETAKRPHAVPLPSVAGKTAGKIKPPQSNKAKTTAPARPGHAVAPNKEEESGPPPGLVPVAVKVLHPGIYRAVQRDLKILRFLAKVVEFIFPELKWLSVRECVEEFAELMERQIDLRVEARCLDKFYDNFEENPNIRFPRPVRPFVKRSILVETFEEGEPMSKYMRRDVQAADGLKEKIAAIGIEALLQMIFQDNFVHGDLHPGNILIMNAAEFQQQDDSKLVLVDVCDTLIINVKPVECPLRLVLLDVGIVAQLSEKDKENFTEVFRAVVLGEGEKVGELLLENASHQECVNKQGFKDDVANIVATARKETIKLGKIQAAELLTSVFSTCSRHKVKLESNFASIIIAIMVLEGLGRVLDPELDLLEKARPMLLSSS